MCVVQHRDRRAPGANFVVSVAALATLTLVLLFALVPLMWMLAGALKPEAELVAGSPTLLPRSLELDSFRRLAGTPFLRQCVNSLVVAAATAIIATTGACTTGYLLGRTKSRTSSLLGLVVLAAYMVAPIMLVIPLFVLFRMTGLANGLGGLVLAHTAFCVPFALWSLRAFFSTLPVELEERAAADGIGPIATLRRVILPMSYPALVSTAVFSFVLSWNEYVFARVLISSSSKKTVPIGIEDLFYTGQVDWGAIMAAGACVLVPAVVLVVALRRHLEGGWLASWQ